MGEAVLPARMEEEEGKEEATAPEDLDPRMWDPSYILKEGMKKYECLAQEWEADLGNLSPEKKRKGGGRAEGEKTNGEGREQDSLEARWESFGEDDEEGIALL